MPSRDDPSEPLLQHSQASAPKATPLAEITRRVWMRKVLDSKRKHYFILGLVALDVSCLLADLFVTMIACDRQEEDEKWAIDTKEVLKDAGLVFSCLFMLELLFTLWAFGLRYLTTWFHIFDALIILLSFVVDVALQGTLEEVASLVIVLRLWRFVKIIEELSVGASERMEDMEMLMQSLESENTQLKAKIRDMAAADDREHAASQGG